MMYSEVILQFKGKNFFFKHPEGNSDNSGSCGEIKKFRFEFLMSVYEKIL